MKREGSTIPSTECNKMALKYMKQKFTFLKKTDNFPIIIGNFHFNLSLSIADKISDLKKKRNNEK